MNRNTTTDNCTLAQVSGSHWSHCQHSHWNHWNLFVLCQHLHHQCLEHIIKQKYLIVNAERQLVWFRRKVACDWEFLNVKECLFWPYFLFCSDLDLWPQNQISFSLCSTAPKLQVLWNCRKQDILLPNFSIWSQTQRPRSGSYWIITGKGIKNNYT